jgi:CheY-like chemotaxis protein/HPt (histidine-containing phosphotransfer) domain-containing protein
MSIGEAEEGKPLGETSQIVKIFVEGTSEGSEPIVLAVDDHPTNRELLARQVEALGLLVQTAVNGSAALALWKAGGIAAVVTDCNMPEMDGYALSRAIREHEEKAGLPRTPIIAWTANVLPSAAALCRAAGMDDILTKPAELGALRKTLTTWLPAAVASTLRPDDVAGETLRKGPVAALTLAGLSKIASTPEQRAEILVDFISNSESDLSDLRAAQRIQDLPACARIAHRMLGSSQMIGATELAEVCGTMERAARMGSSEDVMKADAAMDGALERLDAHLVEAKRVIAV